MVSPRTHRAAPGTRAVHTNHDADQHDDRAIALALAASKLLERPASSGHASLHWDAVPMAGSVGYGTPGYGDVL